MGTTGPQAMAGQGSTSRMIPSQGVVPVRNSTLVTPRIFSDLFQSMGKSVRFTIPGRRYVRRIGVCQVVHPVCKRCMAPRKPLR